MRADPLALGAGANASAIHLDDRHVRDVLDLDGKFLALKHLGPLALLLEQSSSRFVGHSSDMATADLDLANLLKNGLGPVERVDLGGDEDRLGLHGGAEPVSAQSEDFTLREKKTSGISYRSNVFRGASPRHRAR